MARRLGETAEAGKPEARAQEAPKRTGRPRALAVDRALDKVESRRMALAEAALKTLAELGYARTSLRDIADKSEFTHGVLHYYFKDKTDLICCAMRQYKAVCATRYDQVTIRAGTPGELIEGVAAKLAETLREDALNHRLWYDLRAQAMFEEAFQADVLEIDQRLEKMVWRIGARLSELSGSSIGLSPAALYGLFDGLFQRSLLRHLTGEASAAADLQDEARRILTSLVR
ncbi:TetR/AcrR family transcriptional regulator [Neomegalonema sp.]|uniref:TetR/AcrR family transcriptional regulator n=1 Tax=Neomegalonema sp. TaxID=2039713 RepID=UPI002604BEF0|nr:TetR family transcriptional regulator [Neomegalonema sp.]MDD2868353.1 TetR family transcriptional regulator [Neomegalonema sp.]